MQELPNFANLGERVRFARKVIAKMTQVELADAIDVSPQAVSGWERGEDDPTIKNREAIASITGVPFDYLVIENGHAAISRFKRPTSETVTAPEIDVRAGAGPGGIAILDVQQNEYGEYNEVDSVKARWGIPSQLR
jgi:transcriptional regulator with XRE-family HTH domain